MQTGNPDRDERAPQPDVRTLNLQITDCCQPPTHPHHLDGLVALLRELVPLAFVDQPKHLRGVLVVPGSQIEATVNSIIRELAPVPATYATGPHIPEGVCVPVEHNDTLSCFIVLSQGLVQTLDLQHCHGFGAVSTLLEEMLHVRLYETLWNRHGYVQPIQSGHAVQADLAVLGAKLIDEYVVSRWKAAIAGTVPIFEHEGERTTGHLQYGEPLAPTLERALTELANTICTAACGDTLPQDAWQQVARCICRSVYEPLAREAGFFAGFPTEERAAGDANASRFFLVCVSPYWRLMLAELDRAFASDLGASDSAINAMVEILLQFLEQIGVTCRQIEGGRSWVDFNSSRIESLLL